MKKFNEWIKNRIDEDGSYTMKWDDLDKHIDAGDEDSHVGIKTDRPERLPYEDESEKSDYYSELSKKRKELIRQLKDLEARMITVVQMRDRA